MLYHDSEITLYQYVLLLPTIEASEGLISRRFLRLQLFPAGVLVRKNVRLRGYLSPSMGLKFSDVPSGLAAITKAWRNNVHQFSKKAISGMHISKQVERETVSCPTWISGFCKSVCIQARQSQNNLCVHTEILLVCWANHIVCNMSFRCPATAGLRLWPSLATMSFSSTSSTAHQAQWREVGGTI